MGVLQVLCCDSTTLCGRMNVRPKMVSIVVGTNRCFYILHCQACHSTNHLDLLLLAVPTCQLNFPWSKAHQKQKGSKKQRTATLKVQSVYMLDEKKGMTVHTCTHMMLSY